MKNGPKLLIRLNWVLLIGSVIAWPISSLTWAKDEPQTVLALSWFAVTYTALTALIASYVNRNQKEDS